MHRTTTILKTYEKRFRHALHIRRNSSVVEKSVRILISEAKALEIVERATHNTATNTHVVWFNPIQIRPNIKLTKLDLNILPSKGHEFTLAFLTATHILSYKNSKHRFRFFLIEQNHLRAMILRQGHIFKRRIEVWM